MALRTEPRASTTAKTRPITISEKYSAGPKSRASLVSGAPSAAMISADPEARMAYKFLTALILLRKIERIASRQGKGRVSSVSP